MRKYFSLVGFCVLGTFIWGTTIESERIVDDLLFKNVEALAIPEYEPLIYCDASGDLECPYSGDKVRDVVQGFGLKPNEETY